MTGLSSTSGVTTEFDDAIAVVSLARPDRLNALNRDVLAQLLAALREVADRRDIRALVLTGEGSSFSSGLDLDSGLIDSGDPDPVAGSQAALQAGVDIIRTMRDMSQPVIAAVRGHAIGAGFAITAAADIRFIAADARFSAPFLRLGVTVGDLGLSWTLPRIIGQSRAAHLLYSAGTMTAEDAVNSGFAPHVSESPLDESLDFAKNLAGWPPYGVEHSKRLLDSARETTLRAHLDSEARAQVIGTLTEPAKAAMKAALARDSRKGA
ncbi:enoyl-CoA hydratase/carnithine racemase [Tamaricihabitans halophyticus]|uniref:Enoyl-CoA hydratase/carnithine racemase n=1 Tax=Tamaricihabitans halophyticus TaxID=1262583 RepID=A0A4R2PYK3_9PSEU|nr:enoyl-CoA hydratase/isomerase family protein [Tamaricihabitans halophyticus]TCP41240.1 enoyl-CoA hydratase/carnithine racemase [Tamaricihabitans halophyticus]